MSTDNIGHWSVSRSSECIVVDHENYQIANTDCEPMLPYDDYYERHAANAKLIAEAPELKTRVAELESILQDLVFGADMMLQPGIPLTPAMRHYIQEVRRVAGAYKEAA